VQTCDQRSARACKPVATQSNRDAPKATTKSAQRAATANRSHSTARHRHAVRHAQSEEPAPRRVESSAAPAAVVREPEPSPAERRFSEFVSPRSFAANPVEALHKPSMNVSELSGQTAYPLTERLDQEPSPAVAAAAPATSPVVVDVAEPAEPPRAVSQQIPAVVETQTGAQLSAANSVSRPGDRDGSEGSTSWVRIVFLTWGGLLTLGSALRLLIGWRSEQGDDCRPDPPRSSRKPIAGPATPNSAFDWLLARKA
jgi:hypothetical protein